jgi:hypothetical protein
MIHVLIVNPESEYRGRYVMVSSEALHSNSFWIPVLMNGKHMMFSRHSLGWK